MNRVFQRSYRVKGALNKKAISPSDVAYAETKGLSNVASKVPKSKYVGADSLPTPANLESVPNNFTSVYTDCGWFVIPKAVFSYRWTKEEIAKLFASKRDHETHSELQNRVTDWVKQIDLCQIPAIDKPTAKDRIKQEEDAMYRAQLKDEFLVISTGATDGAGAGAGAGASSATGSSKTSTGASKKTPKESTSIRRTVNYTHAWNYFSSIFHRESGLARSEISRRWKEMSMEQKEEYRLQYSELLKSGRDIHRGQIITVEEKLKINEIHQKSKRAKRERDNAKAEEVAKLLRARDQEKDQRNQK